MIELLLPAVDHFGRVAPLTGRFLVARNLRELVFTFVVSNVYGAGLVARMITVRVKHT